MARWRTPWTLSWAEFAAFAVGGFGERFSLRGGLERLGLPMGRLYASAKLSGS